jgi:5-methylcytosine-specific restriction endonuclease McrA
MIRTLRAMRETDVADKDFWEPRRCMREPIPEIFEAAFLLDIGVGAHIAGDYRAASEMLAAANIPEVRAWTESLLGSKSKTPEQQTYHRSRVVAPTAPVLAKAERHSERTVGVQTKRALIERYGRNCVFCSIPLIREQVRTAISRSYPEAVSWGAANFTQHAALQCMSMQYDHVLPHSRGGNSSLENMVLTCAPCNYGRMQWTLEEVGLIDPRLRPAYKTSWDGLERFLLAAARSA